MRNSRNHIMKVISIFVVLYWCIMSIELQMSQIHGQLHFGLVLDYAIMTDC